MKKILVMLFMVICTISFSVVNPVKFDYSDNSKKELVKQLKGYSEKKWDDDYGMVKYEYKKQADAFMWLNKNVEDKKIFNKALKKWDDDYGMVKYEYKKQTDALVWLNKNVEDKKVFNKALKKWKDDYGMVKYEYKKQMEAKEYDFKI